MEEMTRAMGNKLALNHNNNNGANKNQGRKMSKNEIEINQPLKTFRSRTESVTSTTSENGQKQVFTWFTNYNLPFFFELELEFIFAFQSSFQMFVT